MCGGLIQNNTASITSRVLDEVAEADCLWTIQADENYVIKYSMLLEEKINHNQCQAHALVNICFFNQLNTDRLFHWYMLAESIFQFRGVN